MCPDRDATYVSGRDSKRRHKAAIGIATRAYPSVVESTMTFVSYAPNCEDVPLWRALGHVGLGRYVDWGTEPADGSSVTRAFYDRGWSGVAVRPSREISDHLAAIRPRDTVFAFADALLLPTVGPVHFLRGDAKLIRLLDFSTLRPWICIVPHEDNEANALLRENGYRVVLFDGLSHFNLSPEHAELESRLCAPANASDDFHRAAASGATQRLAVAESALLAAQTRLESSRQQLFEATRTAGRFRSDVLLMTEEGAWLRGLLSEARDLEAKSRANSEWLRGQMTTTQGLSDERVKQLLARTDEVAWLRSCLADSEAHIATLTMQLTRVDGRLGQAEEAARTALTTAAAVQAQLDALRASLSWRITGPLRRIRGFLLPKPIAETTLTLTQPQQVFGPFVQPAENVPAAQMIPAQTSVQSPQLTVVPPPYCQAISTPPPDEPAPAFRAAPDPAEPTQVAPLTTVHQFHAGSAAHDAITNSMLLIRSLLRAAGFRSEIFVEDRGKGVDCGIRLMESLPDRADYVLLVHHSMGYPSFDALMANPAKKVLFYHNITPADLLCDLPHLQNLAKIGRKQLAKLRDHVVFALSASDYNSVELRRLGFPAVRTCPLLFDLSDMTRRSAGLRRDDGVFTVLFVGRITPSKAQDALIDAFAIFRERFGRACRLVLVGALDLTQHRYLDRIEERITVAGLEGIVELPGLVSDAELDDWYCQANLYVSLSRHEGFGVPLVEALARAIPVIAWPTGAVPFTVGKAATLLTSREPQEVAAAMVRAATSGVKLVPQAIDKFKLERQSPTLMMALAAAGALPPIERESRTAIAANLRVAIAWQNTASHHLAEAHCDVARAIESRRTGRVRVFPIESIVVDDTSSVLNADTALISTLAKRAAPDTGPELVLSGYYPAYIPDRRGDVTAALFFWEDSPVPQATVALLNRSVDMVLAPSCLVCRTLVDSGVSAAVLNVGQVPDLAALDTLVSSRDDEQPFTFLHVCSAPTVSGLDVLLAAWARAFAALDRVKLVIKTFANTHADSAAQLAKLRTTHVDLAPIALWNGEFSKPDRLALYAAVDAVVMPGREDCHNKVAAEAMAAGLPLIVTGRGSHMDFCTADTARVVQHRMVPSTRHVASPHSLSAEPDESDLVAALREASEGLLSHLVKPARRAIAAATDTAKFTARVADAATCVLLAPRSSPVRLTWVSSWDVRCGLAEYSRLLLEAMPRDGLAPPVILADHRTPADDDVRPAWQVGDADCVDGLSTAIERTDPDITVLQHQPGLLPWPGLSRLLEGLATAERDVIVTLHNTQSLIDLPSSEQDAMIQALRRTTRVIVHTPADLQLLDEIGVNRNTLVLPHPAPSATTAATRKPPLEAAPMIGCTGFFLPGKGIAELISTAAKLCKRFPGMRLRLVNAEHSDPSSVAEIAACRQLAQSEDLAVEWHTDFISLSEQRTLLQECDLLVLPYQHSKEGSSAALRSALASGVPVAVTPLPLFDEAAGAVFRLPGFEPAAMELGIANLLAAHERRASLVRDAHAWLADRSAPEIAQRLHGCILGLAAQRRLGAARDGSLWTVPENSADE